MLLGRQRLVGQAVRDALEVVEERGEVARRIEHVFKDHPALALEVREPLRDRVGVL